MTAPTKTMNHVLYVVLIILIFPKFSWGQWNILCQLNGGPLHPGVPIEADDYITGFCFPNKDTGYYYYNYNTNSHVMMSSGNLMRSTDGGHNWSTCYSYSQYVWANLSHASFLNAREGFITALFPYQCVFKSSTGSTCTWNNVGFFWSDVIDLCTVSKDRALCIFSNGYIYRWDNNQDTLIAIITHYNFTKAKLDFVDMNLGYLIGVNSNSSVMDHSLFRTTDGGYHWDAIFHTTLDINDISTPDHSGIFLACDSGIVYKKTDTASPWIKLQTSIYDRLIAISFYDSLRGFAISSDKIVRTVDGGLSWVTQLPTSSTELRDIEMITDSTAFIIGYRFSRNVLLTNTGEGNQGLNELKDRENQPVVYPNPAQDEITVLLPEEWQQKSTIVASIFDRTGNKVQEQLIQSKNQPIKMDLYSLSPGMYIIRLASERNIATLKLIITN